MSENCKNSYNIGIIILLIVFILVLGLFGYYNSCDVSCSNELTENQSIEPTVSEQAPIVSVVAPTVSEQAPIVSVVAPTVSEQAPIVSEQAPIVSEQAPIVSVVAPSVSEQSPIVS
jgi:hypothetical protein